MKKFHNTILSKYICGYPLHQGGCCKERDSICFKEAVRIRGYKRLLPRCYLRGTGVGRAEVEKDCNECFQE